MNINRLFSRDFLVYTLFSLIILLSGCSQDVKNTASTIEEVWKGHSDASISSEKIQQLPYASIFVNVNDGPKLFMALAFAERNNQNENVQLKWLSADRAEIVTENGRVLKTTGFNKDNLAGLVIDESNQNTLHYETTLQDKINASYDWQPNFRYNFLASIQQTDLGYETITSPVWTKKTHHIQEEVRFQSLNTSFKNNFWVDSNNRVVKTIQYLGPNMDKVEITFLKPYIAPSTKKENSQ